MPQGGPTIHILKWIHEYKGESKIKLPYCGISTYNPKKFQNTTTRCKSFLSSVKNQINTQHIQLKHEGNRPCLLMSSKLQD